MKCLGSLITVIAAATMLCAAVPVQAKPPIKSPDVNQNDGNAECSYMGDAALAVTTVRQIQALRGSKQESLQWMWTAP